MLDGAIYWIESSSVLIENASVGLYCLMLYFRAYHVQTRVTTENFHAFIHPVHAHEFSNCPGCV